MNNCKTIKAEPSFNNDVSAFFESFNKKGLTADFADRRGRQQKLCILEYTTEGQNVFAINKLVTFTYDSQIDSAIIESIEILSLSQMAVAPTSPNAKDIPETQFDHGMLILKDDCDEIIVKTPLRNLCRATNGNQTTFFNLKNVNWAASGIEFNVGASISAANAIVIKVNFTP